MPDSYYESKKRWNAANYKQFNIAVRPELSEEFQAACIRNQTSMREAITGFMATYAAVPTQHKSPKIEGYNDRRQRRKALADIVAQIEMIRDAEEQYKENIPGNLRASVRYENAEQTIEALNEAIELLETAFS